jgi:Flp pilus assembly protein TadG
MRRRAETGAVSTEVAVLTPLIIGFMLLVVYAGRVAQAEGSVANAAHEAARAASLQSDLESARIAAEQTAAANVVEGVVSCRRLVVEIDPGLTDFTPGGQVALTVSCEAAFGDIAMLAVPGTKTFTATAIEVIDTYRADPGASP